ncbi:MAG: hypothetical protein AABZ60_11120 [Planctomycetota bacterium]
MQNPDFVREPYLGWCDICRQWVITLNGHCFNDDKHRTSIFTPEERKYLYSSRSDYSSFEY